MSKFIFSKMGIALFLGILIFSAGRAFAGGQLTPTPLSMDFYGSIEGAKAGDTVAVYDGSGTLCGRFVINKDGQYGFIHVYGDDSTTVADEGADLNDNLTFKLNGEPLTPSPADAVIWLGNGQKKKVDFIRK